MFQIDEYVYYASGGVCRVTDIQSAPLAGMPEDRLYYVLRSLHDGGNGVMYVPVDSETVFIRPLMDRETALALVRQIPEIEEIEEPNAKALRGRYIDAMKMHAPAEWVRVIKTVRRRIERLAKASRTQRISDTERALAEDAKRYLHAELSIALEIPLSEMETYIRASVSG